MSRNLHRIAGALERMKHDAATGKCWHCPRQSVGYIQRWDNTPMGVCGPHKEQGERLGYTVWPDPFADLQAVRESATESQES